MISKGLVEELLKLRMAGFNEFRKHLATKKDEALQVAMKGQTERDRSVASGRWQVLDELEKLIDGAPALLEKAPANSRIS